MTDMFTETSREGYFSRIGSAIGGVVFGGILFLVSFVVLFWNEGNAVKTAKALAEGQAACISLESPMPRPENNGKVIHFSADATGQTLHDSSLAVSAPGIHLQRIVEMYQWKEDKKSESQKDTVGGGTTTHTTYSYAQVWSEKLIDSTSFKLASTHANPTEMRFKSLTTDADKVTAGGFTLPPLFSGKITNYKPVPLTADSIKALPEGLRDDANLSSEQVYISGVPKSKPDASNPQTGDLRVSAKVAPNGPISVVGKQANDSIEAFVASNGRTVALLEIGTHSAQEMFQTAVSNLSMLTWILRAVGFVVMVIGLSLILNPLKVLADVVGIIGDIVGAGIFLVALVTSIALSSLTIAIAWLVYRPLIGGLLLAVAIGFIVLLHRIRTGARAQRIAAAPTA